MKLAIIIPTYQRNDGQTPFFLKRALNSVLNQNHQDYVVYLIGDKYEDNNEFETIAKTIISTDKIKFINLPNALEREKYPMNSKELCLSASVNANNVGIDMVLKDNLSFVCHLDHDDYWEENHLFEINNIAEKYDNCGFITTTGKILNTNVVAPVGKCGEFYPYVGTVYHSATCVNYKLIPLRYRDVFAVEKTLFAADGDLWKRLTPYMKANNLIGYHVNKITSYHTSHHYDKIK